MHVSIMCNFLTIAPSGSIMERGVSLVVSCIDIALVFVKQKSLNTLDVEREGCVCGGRGDECGGRGCVW